MLTFDGTGVADGAVMSGGAGALVGTPVCTGLGSGGSTDSTGRGGGPTGV